MTQPNEPIVRAEVMVEASQADVWAAWTTEAGITSFFAPACNLDLRVDGPYEILFFPEAEPRLRGGEGLRLLAMQPPQMLSFTWNAPPSLPSVRGQWTHVTVRLHAIDPQQTHVTLTHDGWGIGGEWDQAVAYFERAWGQVILPRLAYRFRHGPIDWDNPPAFPAE